MAGVDISVDKSIIVPIIETQVREALINALGGQDRLIAEMVDHTLQLKVNGEGKVGKYSSENKTPFIEWLARDAIRSATKAALKTYMDKHKHVLEAEIERQIVASTGPFVKAFLAGITQSLEKFYRFIVKIELPGD